MPDEIQPDEIANWLERLESAKQGDREALGWLLQNYWQPLWDQADSGMGERLRAAQSKSDLVQETLIDAQQSLRDFRGQTPKELQAWFQAILTNNIRDAWRATNAGEHLPATGVLATGLQSNAELTDEEVSHEAVLPSTSASSRSILNENEALIEEILRQLPQHYQVVLRLRHWDSMTFEAIGKSMNKSTDTVRQLWYRSVELFAEILDQHDSK